MYKGFISRILGWIELIFPVSLGSFLALLAIFGYFQNMNENLLLMKYGDMHVLSIFFFVLFIIYFYANEKDHRLGFYIPIQTYAIHEVWFFTLAYDFKYVSFERFAIGLLGLTLIIIACFFISSLPDSFKIDWLIAIWIAIGLTYVIWLWLGFHSTVGNNGIFYHTQYYNDISVNATEIFSWAFPLTVLMLLSKRFLTPKPLPEPLRPG